MAIAAVDSAKKGHFQLAAAEQQGAGDQQQAAGEYRRRNAQPLHDDQRQAERAEEGAERGPVERHAARLAGALGFHQVGQDRHRLAEQPGERAEDAADEEKVGDQRRLQVDEQPVDSDAGQPETGQRGGDQEVAGDDASVIGFHPGAGSVAERQREQEEADGRRGDDDRAADMRHQPAQGDDFGAERAEAFDEDDGVDEQAGHRRIIADPGTCPTCSS